MATYINAVFSGRFDPPNLGHVLTLEHLLKKYRFVLVPILDYSARGTSARSAKIIFEHHFSVSPKIKFVINKTHFGEIPKTEYYNLLDKHKMERKYTIYLAGNSMVLAHFRDLCVPYAYVPRVQIQGLDQYIFESTKIRETMKKTGESLAEIYNLK